MEIKVRKLIQVEIDGDFGEIDEAIKYCAKHKFEVMNMWAKVSEDGVTPPEEFKLLAQREKIYL